MTFQNATLDPVAISTVAGTGNSGNAGDGGAATSATFDAPVSVLWVHGDGVYVADSAQHRVRLFTDGGNIDAFAGTGVSGDDGDFGDPVAAKLTSPVDLGFVPGSPNTIAIMDVGANRIRLVGGGLIAGLGGPTATYGGDGGAATSAQLNTPTGVAWDTAHSSLYISDTNEHRVRKVDGGGNISTVAGDGVAGFVDDGTSRLTMPTGLAVDGGSNLYIADTGNKRVRKLAFGGGISTIAGTGTTMADASAPTDARFDDVRGIAPDGSGNLFVSDAANNRIRRIDKNTGAVTTVAGDGRPGTYAGDGGVATAAGLKAPYAVAVGANGATYVTDLADNRVRKVSAAGVISTFAGSGSTLTSGDGGPAIEAGLPSPSAIAADSDGNVYVASDDRFVRKIAPDGTISTVAGGGICTLNCDGDAPTDVALEPTGLALNGGNDLYISDGSHHFVYKVDFGGGKIHLIAGDGSSGDSGDGGQATDATLSTPDALAVDGAASLLYVSDTSAHRVRVVDLNAGTINAFLGDGTYGDTGDNGLATSAEISDVRGIAVNRVNHSLYFSEFTNGNRIREVRQNGNVYALSGGTAGYAGDGGPYSDAGVRFNGPAGLALREIPGDTYTEASLLVADGNSRRVRSLSLLDDYITTIAGNGAGSDPAFGGDGASDPTQSQLDAPGVVAIDGNGFVYWTDRASRRVRRIFDGRVETFAGTGGACVPGTDACGQTFGATSTDITDPAGLAIDGSNNVYISDEAGCRVWKVDPFGVTTIVAGTGTCGSTGNGGDATAAKIDHPTGLTWYNGELYIAERAGNQVRKVDGGGNIQLVAGDGTGTTSGDGGDATAAGVPGPVAIAFETNGDMLIAQAADGQAAIRVVDHIMGHISTVAGGAFVGFGGDKGGALGAGLFRPTAMYVDPYNHIYVAEGGVGPDETKTGTSRIRKIVGPL